MIRSPETSNVSTIYLILWQKVKPISLTNPDDLDTFAVVASRFTNPIYLKRDYAHAIENSTFPLFSLRRVQSLTETMPFAIPITMFYDLAAPADCIFLT